MNQQQLRKITEWLVINFFINEDIIYPLIDDKLMIEIEKDNFVSIIDIIATLHNLLSESVTGNRYNYMFHWLNKIGYSCDDDIFDDFLKGEEK